MLKTKLARGISILLILLLVFGNMMAVVATDNSGDDPLLGNDRVKKPSVAGALSLGSLDGQMTLVDQNGDPIQLRGMSTHGLQWFGEIVNENAFAALANDWESNMIRLAMYVGENGYATNPQVKDLVYEGIELAFENDMYVIVDWHVHAPGDPRADVYSGAYDFFEALANHYKDHPKFHYIIWELANEPSPNNNGGPGIPNNEEGWQAVKEYAEPLVEMLNEKGDNIILVGSPNWSQRPDLAADDPIDGDNIMYSVHFYTGTHEPQDESYPPGTPSNERSNVMGNARYALENGVALFATEWGTSEASGDNGPFLDEADVWLRFLNENNISWANWSLTNKNETSGSFIPFILNESDATDLDPGPDQVWSMEELSVSGEYVRSRIKGIDYDPIDRTPREDFSVVIWDFDDGTTQGFGVNSDSPVMDVVLSNHSNTLMVSGLSASNDLSEGNYWANVRLSSDGYNPGIDILGAEELTMEVLVDEPTTVSIAAIPQSSAYGWANPERAVQVTPADFELQDDGKYLALLTISTDDAPNLGNIGMDPDGSILTNMILFIGTENEDVIYLDNISVSGNREAIPEPVEHADLGVATLPSDFEDGTRQGWTWNSDSAVRTALTIEEANGSNAISWEYAYPEVKPGDNWATAPRLDLWKENLTRGNNDFVIFDLYIDPVRATEGAIAIHGVFQPPGGGFWQQSPESFNIEMEQLANAEVTAEGYYHYEVIINIRDMGGITDDMELRNMMFVFQDVDSDFAGRVFLDNIRFEQEPITPEDIHGKINGYVDDGSMRHPAGVQLTNTLTTAERHFNAGRHSQAQTHLDKLYSILDSKIMSNVSEEVKDSIRIDVERLSSRWFE
ncbi:carbohydrate-binding domain-containing protein [Evansella tamaricis]|uniref:cellulase n=1 Tax=Evansella tamaricis TaxID=2069301 RepID=A0ABS6JL97_9BACI|nr:carbohydrate-binding domain-containing protein [Evansella tamaricis]MBU9713093.1 cellulase family glycosylhydrolase [Evansella tamaricis]